MAVLFYDYYYYDYLLLYIGLLDSRIGCLLLDLLRLLAPIERFGITRYHFKRIKPVNFIERAVNLCQSHPYTVYIY